MSSNLTTLQDSVLSVWTSILLSLPNLLAAAVIFVVGIFIAVVLSRAILKIVGLLHLDELAGKFELRQSFERLGITLHIGALLAWIVKWFFIIVALVAATDILGWDQLTDYLKQIILFIPNVIIAVIVLLAGILLGNFVKRIVKSAVDAAHLSSADFLAGLAKWSILLFSFMAALVQLQIAQDLINTLFTGLVAMLALSGGLAFGLGGRDHAARFLDKLRQDISSEK